MKVYQLRVSIIDVPKIYRIIEVSDNCTFEELHDAIFDAFDRYDHHLFSFFITRHDTKSKDTIWNSPEITHPDNMGDDFWDSGQEKTSAAKVKIGDAGLEEKDVFHYWFDFGDDWWHRIRVQSIRETNAQKKMIKLVKAVGESPPQYPDYDDDFDEEYE